MYFQIQMLPVFIIMSVLLQSYVHVVENTLQYIQVDTKFCFSITGGYVLFCHLKKIFIISKCKWFWLPSFALIVL